MSRTAGVWSETALQDIFLRADQIAFDDRLKLDYMPRIDLIEAIDRISTAQIAPLNNNSKDYDVQVMWINNCALAAQSCTSCSISGNELSTNAQTYQITQCQEVPFKVDAVDFYDNFMNTQEVVAKGMLTAEKLLIEQVVQNWLTVISTAGGTNQWNGDAGIATVLANETRINPVNYTAANMIAYFAKVAQFNQFDNPVMVSGNLLWNEYKNAQYNAGSSVDTGNLRRFGDMDWYWDIFNFNALALDLYQYMIQVGTFAFANRVRPSYPTTPLNLGDNILRWSRPATFWPKMLIEWEQTIGCSYDQPIFNIKAKVHWEHLQNPAGCDEANTGTLAFHAI